MNDVPLRTRTLYGLGSVAEGTKDSAFSVFVLFYYNNVLGLPGGLAGLSIFLALCVDALVDPLIASASDKTRTRWGRRHPYMYAAVLPLPALFWLVFDPPSDLGTAGLFAWMTLTSILLRACLSLYAVSSNALVAEMTRRYDERTEILGFRFLYGWLAGIAVAFIGYIFFFAAAPDGSDGRMNADAYAKFGVFCGVVCALAVLLCAAGTHKLIPSLRQPLPSQQGLARLFVEVRELMSLPSFRAMFGTVVFSAAAWGYINAAGYYMNTYFWALSARDIGLLSASMVLSVFIAFGVAPTVARRFDKKPALVALKGVGIVLGPLPIVLRYFDLMPANGTGALLLTLGAHTVLLTALVIVGRVLGASMVADTTDEGELAHGERREGMYAAVLAFAIQASSGIGGLLAGLSLDLIRFPRQAPVGAVPPAAVDALGYVVGPVLMLLFALSLWFLLGYRISRARHREIVERLGADRAAAH